MGVTAVLVLVVLALVAGFALATHLSGEMRERAEIRKAPRATIAAAPIGQALRLVGTVRLAEPLSSPVSSRACAWYRIRVFRPNDPDPAVDETEARDFELEDDTGRAAIAATSAVTIVATPTYQRFGAGLLAPTPGLLQLLERHGRADLLAGIGSVRVEERVLAADAAGLVYGFVDHETGSAAASYREAPQRVVVHQPLRITDDMTLA